MIDPLNQRATLLALMARAALGKDADPTRPVGSALLADLHGLPPLLMQVGEREIVLLRQQQTSPTAPAPPVLT
jgi:monoterpene epsilon-lactone hydrolase